MTCDPNCASPCEDRIGCARCIPGYYTNRQDPEWPNVCKRCTIPNCFECRSDIYDAWPMQCIQCVGGFTQADNKQRCVPIPGSVAGRIVTRPAEPEFSVKTVPQPDLTTEPQQQTSFRSPGGLFVGTLPRPQAPLMDMGLPPGYVMPQPKLRPQPVMPELQHVPVPPKIHNPAPATPPLVGLPARPEEGPKPVIIPSKPEEPPRQVVIPPKPEVSPETLLSSSCPTGSFLKKMDGSCMECDVNCLPGECGDGFGCRKCADGFFTRAADPEWPFLCVLCDLPNCIRCVNNAFDAWPKLCEECAPGYELSTDRKCVPVGGVGRVGGIGQQSTKPVPIAEPAKPKVVEPKPSTDIGDRKLTPRACPKGQFMKEHDGTCMVCDNFCKPGSCIDHEGCRQCISGYYRSRRDLFWPFLCIECAAAVTGCEVCQDGGFDQLPVKCLKCSSGYASSRDGFGCKRIE